jgi:phosphohistidine phosphatase
VTAGRIGMKTLIILRHGKAEEYAQDVEGDRARALKGRGQRDARAMGKLIGELVKPDLVVSSDAVRARQTAEIAAEAFGYKGKIELDPSIYYSGVDTLLKVVSKLPDKADCVVLVGHNPGFESLSSALAAEGAPDITLPTAGFAHLEFDVKRWRDVRSGRGRLVGVHSPKD